MEQKASIPFYSSQQVYRGGAGTIRFIYIDYTI